MSTEIGLRTPPIAWLEVGFALTGVGTTLLGCILPSLSPVWQLDDKHAGALFAAQFTGSALGALLVRNDFFRSVLRGYFLLVIAAAGVGFSAGLVRVFLFFAFGLGLGLAMTATSMLIGKTISKNRGVALSVLNAFWGLGAAVSPPIASLWAGHWSPPHIFIMLSAAFAITLIPLFSGRAFLVDSAGYSASPSGRQHDRKRISVFAVIAFLYVGTEASVSGWMMTYVHRLPISGNAWAAVATSCFWIALICGRALAPLVMRSFTEPQLFTSSLLIAFLSTSLLLLSHSPLAVVLSATTTGLMLAPIFPLCLAKVLALMHDAPESKWIFAISGLGGAFLPWVTGELSAHTGSLRSGLLVAVFSSGTMIVLDRLGSGPPISFQNKSSAL
jgi:fucose permease